jgi:hypothetical protein
MGKVWLLMGEGHCLLMARFKVEAGRRSNVRVASLKRSINL